jgi:hypothetical protein
MKSNTQTGIIFDMGSLFNRFQAMKDNRKARGKRYTLTTMMVLMVLAKLSGEDQPSGMAEWAQYRAEELDQMVSAYLTDKQYFGKQVLVSIDGKTLRGSLNDEQEGTYLLAACLPGEGVV